MKPRKVKRLEKKTGIKNLKYLAGLKKLRNENMRKFLRISSCGKEKDDTILTFQVKIVCLVIRWYSHGLE